MLAITGYIDGNSVVVIDNVLHDFTGSELLIRIAKKPKSQSVVKKSQTTGSERLNALKSLQGVLKSGKSMSLSEIREKRLAERYGL